MIRGEVKHIRKNSVKTLHEAVSSLFLSFLEGGRDLEQTFEPNRNSEHTCLPAHLVLFHKQE